MPCPSLLDRALLSFVYFVVGERRIKEDVSVQRMSSEKLLLNRPEPDSAVYKRDKRLLYGILFFVCMPFNNCECDFYFVLFQHVLDLV